MARFFKILGVSAASCLLLCAALASSAMTDSATGITFAPKINDLEITGVGVRKKGPIKVYSVGMYTSALIKEKLSALSRTADKVRAFGALRSSQDEGDVAFFLKMNFKVGAEKFSSAISESVAPRHSGDPAEVEQLKANIFAGLAEKGAATKGTTFLFNCSSVGIDVMVDDVDQGCVESPGLSKAFCDVYLDDNCVSPPLPNNCLENWCKP
mmetsp:Transcript_33831/g.49732  ORF Transcript_33831/g.49732 Transcript_33831/m.49732 type:complete len:211 (+) Transcript_33831:95-727(+)|eukprot:CAMPEP_0195526170 /NCGR_PEP_ID=MMETSP0794_2-20130614/27076_1 /TAXON_ID=515487 /ORGANISM="Stephanopyxis turris, Strain CCMP 815" /LENGTH=210 /DNA_ID=CAMNT_0040656793 /DNA_START=77 /DNA_END=709 /DNA_ORIENTATION=-